MTTETHAAPVAALPAGAATPATASAPVAPDFSTAPVNPVEFQRALTAELMQLANPAQPRDAAAAQGSPAATAASPVSPAVPAEAVATAADSTVTAEADADDAPATEVLGEAGQRALQAEREKRKAARAEVATLKQEIEQLKAQLQPPAATPQGQPGQPPVPPVTPSVPPAELADCETFDAVDACAMRAVTTEAMAMRLNTVLATEGLQAVVEQFRESGIETFRGKPLEDLTPGQLAADLSTAMQNARTVQLQSANRKQMIAVTAKSFGAAVDIVPGLKDPKSESSRLFQGIVSANPAVKQLGPNWPVLVAKQILAEETLRARVKPPTAAMTPAPVPTALPTGPGAPRTSTAAVRSPSELESLSQRIASGQASAADMKHYARLSLAQPVPV